MEKYTLNDRLTKYWFHYVIILPALLLILVFKVIPLIGNFVLPFVQYNLFKGFFNSPWVGFNNFKEIFQSVYWSRILSNTLALKAGFIVAASLTAIAASLALSSINSKKIKSFFTTVFLIPYFIPAVVFAYIVIYVLSPSSSPFFNFQSLPLAQTQWFRLIFILVETIRNFGIPTIVALAAIHYRSACKNTNRLKFSMKFLTALKAVSAFILIQISSLLSLNFEMLNLLYSPMVYEVADTMETFIYRNGLVQASFSSSAAISLIKFIVHLICSLGAYFILKNFFKKELFGGQQKEVVKNKDSSCVPGTIIAVIFSIPVALVLFLTFIYPFFASGTAEGIHAFNSTMLVRSFLTYGFAAVFSVIVNAVITLTLAYPLTVRDLPGKLIYKIFLIIIMVAGSGSVSEYLFFRKLGMFNTMFPFIITGFFTIINVFVLKSIFNAHYGEEKIQSSKSGKSEVELFFSMFVPKCLKPLLALGILQFITMWNSFRTILAYNANSSTMSPAMLFRNMISSPSFSEPSVMKTGMLITIPSLALFIIFRKLINSEVLIGRMRKM